MVIRLLLAHRAEDNPVSSSPHFAAIIIGSLFWVFYAWTTRLVRGERSLAGHRADKLSGTPGHAFANLAFFVFFVACCTSFYKGIRTDPGYIPKPLGDTEVKMASVVVCQHVDC